MRLDRGDGFVGASNGMSSLTTPIAGEPQAVDHRSSAAGLRTVASFEAAKGIAVVLLGIILLFVHERADDLAERLLFHLHFDPDRRFGHAFLRAANSVADARLLTIIAAALSYSTVRFIEAWGLWNKRVWAEWFAMLSGAMYLPWELLKLAEKPSWDHIAILSINVVIVLYMVWIRLNSQKVHEVL